MGAFQADAIPDSWIYVLLGMIVGITLMFLFWIFRILFKGVKK